MNDKWQTKHGRYYSTDQQRISRRFRHHVQTKGNPKGKIIREKCFNYKKCRNNQQGEFHHISYEPEDTFRGVWVCFSCHRRVDHGTLKLPKEALRDYTKLLNLKPEKWKSNDVPF